MLALWALQWPWGTGPAAPVYGPWQVTSQFIFRQKFLFVIAALVIKGVSFWQQ